MDRPLVIETWGGIGDAWLATPALRALRARDREREIRLFCQDNHLPVFEHNPHVDYMSCLPEDPRFQDVEVLHTNYGSVFPSIHCSRHATEVIGDLLGVEVRDRRLDVYLTADEEDRGAEHIFGCSRPVALHITSGSLPYKHWPLERWTELVRVMGDLTFLQLGERHEPRVPGTIDLRGMTTIREAIAVVKHARVYLGIDSFLNHATSATGTPGVVLFGPSTPRVWGHEGNTNLFLDAACSPCVDTIGKQACPHANFCMLDVPLDQVVAAVRGLVGSA